MSNFSEKMNEQAAATGQTAGRSITGSTTGSASDGRIRERISEQTRTLPRNPYELSDRAAQIAVTSAAESVRHEPTAAESVRTARLAELLAPEVERVIAALTECVALGLINLPQTFGEAEKRRAAVAYDRHRD